ncbi:MULTISPECIES: PD-(D/E)XK nuclease family protein [Olivibacter]|jgi:hypothetical protein|uniref:PD-(D/E)XK nuclease family protein n=1 Tax=Olivibacter jilunii TaxID=985016 RepID=A0ABW6B8S3_9SPHI|nr:PD-(D/E)XK nuclease family protein [Olivibacter jilunii]MCL4639076.1 exodeoxyribonuclease V subunit gamma [Olivibacter sp. UJ_SKK_5.1]MDX3912171.1 exodeoxyribonuclease V subunit gamma [Pseudosphingobacterium sp.]
MIPFLKEVANDLIARFGSELKDIAIIFNNKRPEMYMKKYLAELIGKPIWSPSFFTVQQFFNNAFVEREADKLTQILTLYQCYNAIQQRIDGKTMSIERFYPMAEIILNDFAQLDYDLVEPNEVYTELYDIALIEKQFPHFSEEQLSFMAQFWSTFNSEKHSYIQDRFIELWKTLPLLYTDFHQALKERGLATNSQFYRSFAKGDETSPSYIYQFKQLVFVGFNALNKAEALLFKKWQKEKRALFYFDVDRYYLDDVQQEAGAFLRRNLNSHGLLHALGAPFNQLADRNQNIKIVQTTSYTAQAKLLDSFLVDKKSTDAISQGLTAVLLADERLLIPTLQSIPVSIETNITMGFPISQSPIYGIVDLWLRIQERYLQQKSDLIYYKDVEIFLSHPLIHTPDPIKEQVQQLIYTNHYINVPLVELQAVSRTSFFDKRTDGRYLIKNLQEIIREIFQIRKEKELLTYPDAAIFTEVFKILNQLYDALSTLPSLSVEFTISLIRKSLQGITAAIEGDPLSGVQVMGLLETRNLDFKEIYILGVNEGILPKTSSSATFIPDSIRRAHGLPVLENQEALSAYLFYRLMQRAEQITLVYNGHVDENSSGEISRFVKQLQFESHFNFIELKQQQIIKTNEAPPAMEIKKVNEIGKILQSYLNRDNSLRPGISATAFTTFLQSPLLFFLKYVAKIKEPQLLTEDFEANRIGSIIHEIMQWFYEELKRVSPHITAQRIKDQLSRLDHLCLKATAKDFYGNPAYFDINSPSSTEKIVLEIVKEYAQIFIHHDLKNTPFTIIELENKQDYVIDFPITVDGKESSVKLYGIIDRVDEKDGKIRIVDYKTGSDALDYTDIDSLFDPSSGKFNKALLQTLFYTYIYEKKTGKIGVEPNLYVARRLRQEGSLFYTKSRGSKFLLSEASLSSFKEAFELRLRQVLEDLFNQQIPFKHDPRINLPYNDHYQEFFRSGVDQDIEIESEY